MKAFLSTLLVGFGAIVCLTAADTEWKFVGILSTAVGGFILGKVDERIKQMRSRFPGEDVGVG